MADNPAPLQERFLIRLPEGMRDRIAEVAKLNGRSMNAEILDRLERSLQADIGLREMEGRMSAVEFQLGEVEIAHDRRLDKVEAQMWKLLEHAGLFDPNND